MASDEEEELVGARRWVREEIVSMERTELGRCCQVGKEQFAEEMATESFEACGMRCAECGAIGIGTEVYFPHFGIRCDAFPIYALCSIGRKKIDDVGLSGCLESLDQS